MKAITTTTGTYKITGERGDFFITENNRGKLEMFLKRDVEVVEIDSMPKAKKYSKCGKLSKAKHIAFQADIKNCIRLEHEF